jgi:hypothetical protein
MCKGLTASDVSGRLRARPVDDNGSEASVCDIGGRAISPPPLKAGFRLPFQMTSQRTASTAHGNFQPVTFVIAAWGYRIAARGAGS